MADRIKRYAVAEKAARYADEIIGLYAEVFRNQGEDTLVRMAAGKWLWEAAFGKPGWRGSSHAFQTRLVTAPEGGTANRAYTRSLQPPMTPGYQ
jgi:hypothetical protein